MLTLQDLRAAIAADPALRAVRKEVAARLGAKAADPGHDLAHAERVALWSLRLGAPGVDRREAITAGLLHDIVNLPKDSPERAQASVRSAALARTLLPSLGFEAAAIERVAEAIRDHSYSRGATPKDPLGRALQDADRLEALGAIGLFRTISTGTRMGAAYFHPDDPWAARRPLDDRRFSVDHFFTKLLALPGTMNTAAGAAEAERRTNVLIRLLEALGDELGVPYSASGQRTGRSIGSEIRGSEGS